MQPSPTCYFCIYIQIKVFAEQILCFFVSCLERASRYVLQGTSISTLKTLLSVFYGATKCNFSLWYFCLFIDNFIYEYYNYIVSYSFNSFHFLPCSPHFLLHDLLLFIIICIYIIYKYNPPSPFSVVHMYMYLGLTTCDWLNHQGLFPGEEGSLSLSTAINCL